MSNDRFPGAGVLLVETDPTVVEEARNLFDDKLMVSDSIGRGLPAVEAGDIELVFLGPSQATIPAVAEAAELLEANPDLLVLLAAASDVANDVLRGAIRSGIRDIIESPLRDEAIAEALSHVAAVSRRRQAPTITPQPGRDGRVVTIMAAKGGSGKTVTATNVAVLLARWSEAGRVVIVDADLQFGDVALVLQVEPKATLVNAAKEGEGLDREFLCSLLAEHKSGLKVLAAPLEPAFADEVSTQSITRILNLLRVDHDFVVVDTAPTLDERLLAILERSDVVLFIVDMDLPSVKNAKLALETLRILNYPSNKIRVVLNRSNSKARLDVAEIERSLRVQIAASIPSDALLPASVNEGVPIVEAQPKSKPAKAFEEVARLATIEGGSSESGKKKKWF